MEVTTSTHQIRKVGRVLTGEAEGEDTRAGRDEEAVGVAVVAALRFRVQG